MRSRVPTAFLFVVGALLAAAVATHPASAATIAYGSFGPVPPGITFDDVEESSGTDAVPLYGAPEAFSIGLDFDPVDFVATSTGGPPDITDGQLNFRVTDTSLSGISFLSLFEAGDYALEGSGTTASAVFAGAIVRVTVTQLDGVSVAPIALTPVNGSVGFNLVANSGIVQPWSLGLGLDIAAQLGPDQRATQIEVVIDNQLLATSEAASVAFLAKKDFRIDVTVPEPGTLLLLLVAGLAALSGRSASGPT